MSSRDRDRCVIDTQVISLSTRLDVRNYQPTSLRYNYQKEEYSPACELAIGPVAHGTMTNAYGRDIVGQFKRVKRL
jgi:hypothetical protein